MRCWKKGRGQRRGFRSKTLSAGLYGPLFYSLPGGGFPGGGRLYQQKVGSAFPDYFSHIDFSKFREGADPAYLFRMLTWMTDWYMHEARQRGNPGGLRNGDGGIPPLVSKYSGGWFTGKEETGGPPGGKPEEPAQEKGGGYRMNVIEVKGLTKDYGRGRGIFGVSFFRGPGRNPGLPGLPNGAGKTTTLRHLMGFLHPIPARPAFWEWTASGRRRKSRSIWATCRGDRLSRRHAGRRVPPVPGRNEREEGPGQGKGTFRTV